ncbi:MAG: hypothetical protein WC939_02155 [Acholeplasmataceae bacterium]
MKTTWKILYIIYAALLLLVVGAVSKGQQEGLYFQNEGTKAIESEEDYEKFYFFYGSVGYHLRLPTMIYDNDQFTLAFFEVYRKNINASLFYIMLYPKDAYYNKEDRVLYYLTFNGDTNEKYSFDRFRNLQMYVLVNENRQAEIKIEDIKSLNPQSITITKEYATITETNEVKVIEETFETNYTIIDEHVLIEKAIHEVGFNDDALKEKGVYPQHYHSMKKYAYIFYLSIVITLIVIVLGAYFLFYFKRGKKAYIGNKKPSKTFKDYGPKAEYKDPLGPLE